MEISVAIIGRNEQDNIIGCLQSVKEADEICYLDTGSTDNTLKKVEKLGWKNLKILPPYKWREDFSHARNTCTQQAKHDWILTIDCDERLCAGGIRRIKRELELHSVVENFNGLKILVDLGIETAKQLRVHKKSNYWHRPAHNKLSVIYGFADTSIEIKAGLGSHHTYDPTMRKRIISRYLNQIHNVTDAEMWYYLGREHFNLGDLPSAITCFEKMRRFTYLHYTDVYIDGLFVLAQCHYLMDNIDESRQILGEVLSLNPNFRSAIELIARINPTWTPFLWLATGENVLINRKSMSIMDDRNIKRRVAQLATLPEREGNLKECCDNIVPFVDEVRVMLNNYEIVPAWMSKMDKVTPVLRKNEKGDAEKFYKVEELKNTIIYILDDDIVYNEVFFNSCHDAVIRHRCPVGFMGKIMSQNPATYSHGALKSFPCLQPVAGIHKVDILGTGALCFTLDDCNISYDDFKSANVGDLWFSHFCKKNNITMLVLPHYPLGYLAPPAGTTIWDKETQTDKVTKLYKELFK